eukprot:m.12794 g.12794  ORF g.12794 m.12794 type:complete len:69 (+) comp24289_c0_seq1:2095-2301(+)
MFKFNCLHVARTPHKNALCDNILFELNLFLYTIDTIDSVIVDYFISTFRRYDFILLSLHCEDEKKNVE